MIPQTTAAVRFFFPSSSGELVGVAVAVSLEVGLEDAVVVVLVREECPEEVRTVIGIVVIVGDRGAGVGGILVTGLLMLN